ncbi:MAG: 4-(cytidine 5'-diphospho)-2-C-methyl-D-erythritol kinase [Planctomycetota bacterium]
MSRSVRELAHAKINLFLEVPARRPDGYHEIETVMHEIDLADEIELERAAETRLEIDDPALDLGEDNLALRALRALERRLDRPLDAVVRIRKRIPAGGGLGGGSSDATAVLRGLDRLHGLGLDPREIESVAAEVGSDTAFFARGGTALCRGRGELVSPLPRGPRLAFVLVLPGIHVPTGPVFGALRLPERPRSSYALLRRMAWDRSIAPGDPALFNRLEAPARRLHPELDAFFVELDEPDARLSGSGSTIFLPQPDRDVARETAARVRARMGRNAFVVESAVRS